MILWDLEDPTLLLLDRFHQAVSFPEMVLAVQSGAGAATVDFSCNGDMLTIDAGDASRAAFAALLQVAHCGCWVLGGGLSLRLEA